VTAASSSSPDLVCRELGEVGSLRHALLWYLTRAGIPERREGFADCEQTTCLVAMSAQRQNRMRPRCRVARKTDKSARCGWMPLVPAFDHRFGWPLVPAVVTVFGNTLIVLSFVMFFFILKATSYAAWTCRVEGEQPDIPSGALRTRPASDVHASANFTRRHTLALASWWRILLIVPFFPVPV
jgi:hypothetical protein